MANVTPRSNLKHNPLYIDLPSNTEYTCGQLVAGSVRVDPTLRPLRISVSLKGYSVFHDQVGPGVKASFFDYSKDIFISEGAHENFDILRRGTATDGKVELPFDFVFPNTVWLAPPSDRNWHHHADSHDHPRFQHSPGFLLPPSLPLELVSDSQLTPRTIYSVEACMDSTVPRMTVHQELKFIPPAPEYDLSLLEPRLELGTRLPKQFSKYKLIRTRKLLPNYAKSSRREKIKDLLVEKELFFGLETLSEVPFVKFNILATPARVLVLGEPLPLTFTVQHLDRSSSLPHPPDLFARRIRVQILSSIHIFVPRPSHMKGTGKEHSEILRDLITLFDRKFDEGSGLMLHDGLQLSELGDVKLTHPKLLSSFTSYGLALEYELRVDVFGECATHEFSGIVCKTEIQIAPKWAAPPPQDPFEEGVTSSIQSTTELPEATGNANAGNARIQMPPRYPSGPTPALVSPPAGSMLNPIDRGPMPPPYMA